jgi:putative hemolysin
MRMNEPIEIGKKFVDIPKIIRDKNPKLYRRLPRFVIRIIERIVHIDEVNYYIYKWRNHFELDWINEAIRDFEIDLTYSGMENIPDKGNPMIVANHPLGGFDGVALMSAVGKVRADLKFPVNDILMKLPGVRKILVPINKHGKNTENIRLLDEAFSSNNVLLFFPAGLVSRKQKEGIRDLDWKHTFVSKAIHYQRDVIPCFIHAYNSNFFYSLAYWRKKLGVKANIEMFFLISEVFKQRKSKIHIHFGKPISYTHFDESKSKIAWAAWTRSKVYELAKSQNLPLK